MIHSIKEFTDYWTQESANTRKLLTGLSDASLKQAVVDDHRTLGRMAWHLIQSIPEMANRTGLSVKGPDDKAPVPATADAIYDAYDETAQSLLDEITTKWKDETLKLTDDMYGQQWDRGTTLTVLIIHEIHHRGQMTVLMRQAGLKVPGVYGPSKEEWVNYGAEPPKV
jgi:uncharacterized damage-inducible protein DinB